jgi:phosphoserine phosphatase
MQEIILIQVSGEDRTGLTSVLAGVLARYEVDVLDMGQAVIHDTVSLGMLIRIPPKAESAPVLKDLLFASYELNLNMKFTPISEERYQRWVDSQGKTRHIVTLLGRSITASHVAQLAGIMAAHDLNINVITRLSGRVPVNQETSPRQACIEFSVSGEPRDPDVVRRELFDLARSEGVDVAFQEDNVFRRNRRLVALDMDSTLVQAEVIDELAKEAGVGEEVSAITEAAMRGEMDFQESLRRRLQLLKGLPESALVQVAERIPLTEGAERLVRNLKRFGYKVAIISGGFSYFAERLRQRLGIDYVYANELEIRLGVLTGMVEGEIVDGPRKAQILKEIAEREDISLQQVIAVGDGANDLPMLNVAGLGIAYRAKPKVEEGAGHSISTLGLDSILYLIGFRDRDTVE